MEQALRPVQKTIFLSIPILDKPELNHIYTVYQAILSSKHRVRIYWNLGDSLISRVRNVHMSVFYHEFKECDYFFSLDSDLEILNCYPNNNIFDKLVEHDKDFVGGLYAIKKPGVRRSSSITADGKTVQFDSGLVEMRWLSSGCWCIKRSAVEKMINAYPELSYDGDDNAAGKKVHALYMPMLYDLKENDFPNIKLPFRKMLSEDWSFAERWRNIGGKIWADTSIVLKHIGRCDYSLFDVEVVKKTKPPTNNLPLPGFDLPQK
jgi:hypothetical protein